MRIPSFIPENARSSSWDSYPLPSQMQDGFQGIPMNQIAVNMFKPCYHSQVTFGTNSSPQYGRNTFGGYELPSSSINEITAMTSESQKPIFDHTTQLPDGFIQYLALASFYKTQQGLYIRLHLWLRIKTFHSSASGSLSVHSRTAHSSTSHNRHRRYQQINPTMFCCQGDENV